MKKRKTISLCMIVKDEERCLENCLNSAAKYVDEIIIVDTGSTDRTLEIAKKFTKKIYHFKWRNDFAAARNFSISKATGDWILILDGDEILQNGANLKRLADNKRKITAWIIRFFVADINYENMRNPDYMQKLAKRFKDQKAVSFKKDVDFKRIDNTFQNQKMIFFKNNEGFRFRSIIHEYIYSVDKKIKAGRSKMEVYHLRDQDKNKFKKNTYLLLEQRAVLQGERAPWLINHLLLSYAQNNKMTMFYKLYNIIRKTPRLVRKEVLNKFIIDCIMPVLKENGQATQAKKIEKILLEVGHYDYAKKYREDAIRPSYDLPDEVKIEIESRCNFKCEFCFNKASFAKNKRTTCNIDKNAAKEIIDQVSKLRIPKIRFTGGEPLLRADIYELLRYAKGKGLLVQLNTNGSLVSPTIAKKLSGSVDNVLISFESYNDKKEEKITGFPGSLSRRIKAIKALKKEKIPNVRVSTVALPENITNFDKIAKVVLAMPIDEWEWYRPISNGFRGAGMSHADVELLAQKIIAWRKKTGKLITIGNALPLCASQNSDALSNISAGAKNCIVVDPRGFLKPEYYIEKNIGKSADIKKAWNGSFMKKFRNLELLPIKCKTCKFKYKCRGGSRHEAKMIFGSYFAADPLAKTR